MATGTGQHSSIGRVLVIPSDRMRMFSRDVVAGLTNGDDPVLQEKIILRRMGSVTEQTGYCGGRMLMLFPHDPGTMTGKAEGRDRITQVLLRIPQVWRVTVEAFPPDLQGMMLIRLMKLTRVVLVASETEIFRSVGYRQCVVRGVAGVTHSGLVRRMSMRFQQLPAALGNGVGVMTTETIGAGHIPVPEVGLDKTCFPGVMALKADASCLLLQQRAVSRGVRVVTRQTFPFFHRLMHLLGGEFHLQVFMTGKTEFHRLFPQQPGRGRGMRVMARPAFSGTERGMREFPLQLRLGLRMARKTEIRNGPVQKIILHVRGV